MGNATIVLADDDRVILSTLAEGLRDAGYTVDTADGGEEALAICLSVKPDLAILDIKMPTLSGIEVAKILAKETATPFMFLSAYSDIDLVEEAVGQGGIGYLVKPIDVANIIPAVEAALHRSRDWLTLKTNNQHLKHALEQDRQVSIATGLIMERHKLSKQQAFEVVRSHARSHGQKLHQVSEELVEAAETLNRIKSSTF